MDLLLGATVTTPSVHYTNAKVVLVGDSGVGKTGLGLVLTGQPFVPTESSHARRVWMFNSQEVELDDGRRETCAETPFGIWQVNRAIGSSINCTLMR